MAQQDESVRVRISAKIEEFKKKMGEVSKTIRETGEKMDEVGSKMSDVGGKMSAGISAPLGLLGGIAAKTASDFESSGTGRQNTLGLTAREAEELNGSARNLWKQGFGESIDQVTSSLATVKQNMKGIADAAELERVTRDATILSETFDSDINEVTRAGNNLMTNFGIESSKAFDLMAKGAQNGLNFSNEMFDNLAEYAPLWADMGYSAEEMFGILERGAQNGVYNLDYINDVMKEFQIRIQDGSKGTSDAMAGMTAETQKMFSEFNAGKVTVAEMSQQIAKDLSSLENDVDRNVMGVQLFGTKWEDLGGDVVLSMLESGKAMEGFEGTMQGMADVQEQTFGQRFNSMIRNLQAALLPLGETLLSLAERIMPHVQAAATKISNAFSGMGTGGQTAVVVLGLLAAAIGPLLAFFGFLITTIASVITVVGSIAPAVAKVTSIFTKVTGVLKKASAIFRVVRVVMLALTGPIGLTIAAIAALIAIGIAVYKNWDQISAWLKRTWTALRTIAKVAFEGMKNAIGAVMNRLKSMITERVELIKSIFRRVDLKEIGSNIIKGLARGIGNAWSFVRDKITEVGNKIKSKFKGIFEIGSPSDVTDDEVGVPLGQGVARGIKRSVGTVNKAISWLSDRMDYSGINLIPSVDVEGTYSIAGSGSGRNAGSGAVDELRDSVIEVPVYLDGREIARASAPYTETELSRIKSNRQRASGVTQFGY